jgi:RimJ/RimL family protein N-acetyltransferase
VLDLSREELAASTPFTASDQSFRFIPLDVVRDWAWITAHVNCHLVEDTGGLVAIDRHGEYAAAMIADSFTDTACATHITVVNPFVLRHRFLQAAAHMLFLNAKRHVIVCMTAANNEKAMRFNRRIGWQEIYRVRDGFQFGVDMVMFEMRREQCPWLSADKRFNA